MFFNSPAHAHFAVPVPAAVRTSSGVCGCGRRTLSVPPVECVGEEGRGCGVLQMCWPLPPPLARVTPCPDGRVGGQLRLSRAGSTPARATFSSPTIRTAGRSATPTTSGGPPHPTFAVGEAGILLHPPLPLAGVSMWMKRGCQHKDSLADGYHPSLPPLSAHGSLESTRGLRQLFWGVCSKFADSMRLFSPAADRPSTHGQMTAQMNKHVLAYSRSRGCPSSLQL